MEIYGTLRCPYVARAVLAARFKRLKHTLGLPKDGIDSADYLKMNPFGKMPTLRDGSATVYDSTVIVEYLDLKSKTSKLVPKAAKAAVAVRQIAAVADYLQGTIKDTFPFLQSARENPKGLEAAKAELARILDIVDRIMPKGRYAAGNRFSIADVFMVPALFYAVRNGAKFGFNDIFVQRPKLRNYWVAIQRNTIAKGVLLEMTAAWQ
jgi:glutathione S-transferase